MLLIIDMKASLKYATVSYQKMLVVSRMISGMSVEKALQLLSVMPKKAWKILAKVVKTAVSNAQVNNAFDWLSIDQIHVWRWPKIKRMRFASRARIHSYDKSRSFVAVFLK